MYNEISSEYAKELIKEVRAVLKIARYKELSITRDEFIINIKRKNKEIDKGNLLELLAEKFEPKIFNKYIFVI
jgi:hypothetical protein